MVDHKLLLQQARANLRKEAFNAMTPEAQAAAAQQGGAPPPPGMDPAAMGGAPPMDPAMAGMDPAMMGMDPAMMGGAMPPEDPAAAGGTPVTLNLEDLEQVVKELSGEGGEDADPDKPKRATNAQIMDEINSIKETLAALAAAQGVQLPAGDVGAEGDLAPGGDAASPDDLASVAAELGSMDAAAGAPAPEMGMDPMADAMAMGLPPGELPPGAMPKMAVDKWTNTRLGRR